ncbi:hypothetical protein ASPWEDRAFT_160204 [Aspergillus wentii DTO 134E9]|uniref:NmrA-like domain-containing protein n=1 Tax=Aspergillus wentii DTO 134E9 TaxID=1073089 RepID=A0A1L9REU8_ASPWE|nr:uncharacterized protein ASPWEDRAFT_160204 [Aspergillus wentii DTO 134E9]OJJ33440.1 hypothetical protein ASPWEDRAFT_160204 [Aspergillus wentii DTO 134E9]
MTLKYLITGATGGLGAQVLAYFIANVPASEYAAASSRESNRKQFTDRGIAFRHVDYNDPKTLEESFHDVENLLFVSTNTFDNEVRRVQHQNFVDAAKKAGVGHVWYTSLAFGGFRSDSKVAVQQAHLMTEEMLRKSGITFTSIREGIYTNAFPLFANWYPQSTTITLPSNGRMALTVREELGEATARLIISGGHEKEIVLLTAQESISFSEVVDIINETTGRDVKLDIVSADEYVRLNGDNDTGAKPTAFFQTLLSWYEGIANGEASMTHPLMKEVLGREPTGAKEAIRRILIENPDYTWHQNYAK